MGDYGRKVSMGLRYFVSQHSSRVMEGEGGWLWMLTEVEKWLEIARIEGHVGMGVEVAL